MWLWVEIRPASLHFRTAKPCKYYVALVCCLCVIALCLAVCQMRVLAVDGGEPARSSTAVVSISVQRNLHDPQFSEQPPPPVTIAEILPAGALVASVHARDADSAVRLSTRSLIAAQSYIHALTFTSFARF